MTMAVSVSGCGSGDEASSESKGRVGRVVEGLATGNQRGLLWQNVQTGEVQSWLLDKTNLNVNGYEDLTWICGPQNSCLGVWIPFETESNRVWWWNSVAGPVANWTFDIAGNVTANQLSWQCGPSQNNCQQSWRPIGMVTMYKDSSGFDPSTGVLRHNATSGELGVWAVNGNQVTQEVSIGGTCGPGCSNDWTAVLTADFDGDGESDILWYNQSTGDLSVWLLQNGNVIGRPFLSWQCPDWNGCQPAWKIVDAMDIDGDGNVDLTWFNPQTGVLSNWLLDGKENVTGTSDFSRGCDAASGCSTTWQPLGFIQFPVPRDF
jgi:hypothetical protein